MTSGDRQTLYEHIFAIEYENKSNGKILEQFEIVNFQQAFCKMPQSENMQLWIAKRQSIHIILDSNIIFDLLVYLKWKEIHENIMFSPKEWTFSRACMIFTHEYVCEYGEHCASNIVFKIFVNS